MREINLLPLLLLASLLPPSVVAAPAAQLWPIWQASAESSTSQIDHSDWQWFLDRYVAPAAGAINLVAYAAVSTTDRQRLQSYLQTLARIDPRDYPRAEQLPYWVNLYNALTVEVVLSHPDKAGILRMGKGWFSIGPWNDEVVTIAGEPVTLNDIEHRILRPIWQDRRLHYALNCASLSCPNLDRQAYTRDNSERLLAANEIAYVNHPRGLRFDDRDRLEISQIYQWYAADFPNDLLGYLAGLHAELARELNAHQGRIRYAYDWTLNVAAASRDD